MFVVFFPNERAVYASSNLHVKTPSVARFAIHAPPNGPCRVLIHEIMKKQNLKREKTPRSACLLEPLIPELTQ